ncbi:hypothetical protein GRI97_11010 [Altererythrobacter xixiisoli]|uniref:Uncharacterized protein n=1 Tax=Croceibacterium xixiisoli TaxID=1476466 RepID=A0A6I4TXZ5_9SPHN|nr:hypothetical protein [Croceibacterium xixiisoli]MXO99518.1 hypothetical protein [Croceibacterium xixiisoli]
MPAHTTRHDFSCWESWPERLDVFRDSPDQDLLACLHSLIHDAASRHPPDHTVMQAAQGAHDCLADDGTRDLTELDAIFCEAAAEETFRKWQARGAAMGRREAQRREYANGCA